VIDFDSLLPGINAGNVLLGSGVEFTTGIIPDAVAVGDTITLSSPDPRFSVFGDDNAISPPILPWR
jgi:hypothetical protein